MSINTEKFKNLLERELKKLEQDLKTVARKNPANAADWEPKAGDLDVMAADENETADKMESFEENVDLTRQFELRLAEIREALKKIEAGTYGICEISGEPIEEKRLEANPAAKTCIKHTT